MCRPSPPAWFRPLFVLFLAALALTGPGCARQSNEPFPVVAYIDAPDNLQGNRYSLDAEIDAQLQWREGVGRLLAVRPLAAEAGSRLPVFIADSLNANLMVAQRYRFELTVRHGGLLHVTALRKL
jgi:hypothetical protein